MNGIRAYNMNINELVNTSTSQNEVDDNKSVSADKARLHKTVNETLNSEPKSDQPVKVDVSPIWKEVASAIDLKDATSDEVANMSSKLFKAGAISFEDHISLSFAKKPDSEEKINFLSHWQDRQEEAVLQGAAHDDLNDIIRIQSVLGFVNSLGE
jgi:hypothetical protein